MHSAGRRRTRQNCLFLEAFTNVRSSQRSMSVIVIFWPIRKSDANTKHATALSSMFDLFGLDVHQRVGCFLRNRVKALHDSFVTHSKSL
jgi:hypothetical protein